jgi:hypothetical protein
MYDSAVVPERLSWPDSPVTHEKTLEFHLVISYYINIYKYIWYRPATPPPPAMGMVPRIGCTSSLESNYHTRYIHASPPPPCGVDWV